MLKKALYWLLGILVFLSLAVAGVLLYADSYLESDQEKLLQDYMATKGLSVAVRNIRVKVWEGFPTASLTVDSLVVRDTTGTTRRPTLIDVQRLQATVSVKDLLAGRLHLEELTVIDGSLHLESDSSGIYNLGELGGRGAGEQEERDPENKEPSYLSIDWEGLDVLLKNVDVRYIHPPKNKDIGLLAREVCAVVGRDDQGTLFADTHLNLGVRNLGLNTTKGGGFLQNTPLLGSVSIHFAEDLWRVYPTTLRIGAFDFGLAAEINPVKTDTTRIHLSSPAVIYDEVRVLLTDELQTKLDRFHATGTFPISADIVTPLSGGSDPEVTIGYHLTGQDLRIKEYFSARSSPGAASLTA